MKSRCVPVSLARDARTFIERSVRMIKYKVGEAVFL